MNNEQKTPQELSESTFLNAACKFFKCKSNKIKVRIISDGQEALVDYKEDQYIITTKAAILDKIEYNLSDINAALHLNIYVWIQATKNTISISKFLPTLVEKLNSPEEAYLLHLALTINSYTRDKYQTFWTTLAAVDKCGDTLGKAIVSAREVYSGFGLLEDLTELTILNGKNDLNLLPDGIFETIEIDDDELTEFFIYSVTDYHIE